MITTTKCPVCEKPIGKDCEFTCGSCEEYAWSTINHLMKGRGLGDNIAELFNRIKDRKLIVMRRPGIQCYSCKKGIRNIFVWCEEKDAFANMCNFCGDMVYS